MLTKVFNHFRLTWRLARDKRVNRWLKVFLVFLPLLYMFIPLPVEIPDFAPVLGLVDDVFLLSVSTLIFNALCPRTIVFEHETDLGMRAQPGDNDLEAMRDPEETRNLAFGFTLIALILMLTGTLVGALLLFFFGVSFLRARWERGRLLANALLVRHQQAPNLYHPFQEAQKNLPPIKVSLFVIQDPNMNAHSFGHEEPFSIVLSSELVEKLDQNELQAVIGHEIGHVLMGHVQLISIMSTSVFGLERLFFSRWSRSCDYSADAIALQACDGEVEPVITALLKVSTGMCDVQIDLQSFLEQLDNESLQSATQAELFSTHPFLRNRILRLVELANSPSWENHRQDILASDPLQVEKVTL